MEDVLKVVQGTNKKFDSLREDVDFLMNRRDRSRSPLQKSPAPVWRMELGCPVAYAEATRRDLDWVDWGPSETMDYNAPLVFSDEEEEGGRELMDQLVEVSEETGKLLKDAWTRSM